MPRHRPIFSRVQKLRAVDKREFNLVMCMYNLNQKCLECVLNHSRGQKRDFKRKQNIATREQVYFSAQCGALFQDQNRIKKNRKHAYWRAFRTANI